MQYEILSTVEFYVNHVLIGSYGYKQQPIVAVRSFFAWNHAELPRNPQFKIRADYETQSGKLTAEAVRDIIKACKVRDRSLYLTKWMAFLDWEGLEYINTNYAYEVGKQIKEGKELLGPFEIPGRKQESGKPRGKFYTFIGKDAALALREYFETERGYPAEGEPLWLPTKTTRKKIPKIRPIGKAAMTMNWLYMVRRVGLTPKQEGKSSAYRTGFAGHETRDAARSLIHKCKLQGFDLDCAEFFMGHVSRLDPNKYDKFYLDKAYVKEQYLIVQPYLNIISNWQPEIQQIRDEQREWFTRFEKATWEQMGALYTPEQLAEIERTPTKDLPLFLDRLQSKPELKLKQLLNDQESIAKRMDELSATVKVQENLITELRGKLAHKPNRRRTAKR